MPKDRTVYRSGEGTWVNQDKVYRESTHTHTQVCAAVPCCYNALVLTILQCDAALLHGDVVQRPAQGKKGTVDSAGSVPTCACMTQADPAATPVLPCTHPSYLISALDIKLILEPRYGTPASPILFPALSI